jgi:hypothetical protein
LVDAIVTGIRAGRADAWPVALSPGTEVTVLQTHVSTVLLAGGHVLKIKKPVAPGFLDFSTLARRGHFCREELRLNRRTAPALYLDVLRIGGVLEAPRFAPWTPDDGPAPPDGVAAAAQGVEPPPLEWALWMRRFPEDQTFDRLAARAALSGVHIDALAGAVAAFQGSQPPSPPVWGEPASALSWALDNLASLRVAVLSPADTRRLQALEVWTRETFERLTPLLTRRRVEGAVIEGHGDLHLGNIAWVESGALLFDALEFSPELRHLDRMAELAFPFMDLLDRGLPQLAWRFLSQVLEISGDHAGLPTLRWFAVYRALVRAKVALLQREAEAASGRIALAERLAWPVPACLVLACGLPGSGKSTVAAMLVEALGAVRLRSDVERKRLYGLAPTERPADPATIYHEEATRRTHERLIDGARAALQGNIPVVVDATFNRRRERDALRAVAAELGVACHVVACEAPPAVLAERICRRQAADNDASDADLQVLALLTHHREPPAVIDPADGADGADGGDAAETLDTDLPLDGLRQRVQALVDRWKRR